jgi:glycine/D-amino acid oxidase-like deaminating enzyme
MLSFWEQNSFVKYDYIVIGGGIVGLSTAIELKARQAEARVLVLERGMFPSGASTKNAGFACFGSLTELLIDIRQIGSEAALSLVQMRWDGLRRLRERLGDARIGYRQHGGFELIRDPELMALDKIDEVNKLLQPLFGQEVFREEQAKLHSFGFNPAHIRTLVSNPWEGQIDTSLMMQHLISYAQEQGVSMLTSVQVEKVHEEDDQIIVQAHEPIGKEAIFFSAKGGAVCTNAFARQLLPDVDLEPGRGQVLVTEPIEGLKFKGVFHYDEGYYYFRNYGDRVIFGGGRNLDFAVEKTNDIALNKIIQDELERQLREIILPQQHFKVAHRWAGIMAFGPDKQPIVRMLGKRLVAGVRLGGMGIAIGSRLGAEIAAKLLNQL